MSKEKFGLRVRQFVSVFPVVGTVVADKAINVQDTKVDAALDELKAEGKRLSRFGINTLSLDMDHANLVLRRDRALQLPDKGKQIEEMMRIKDAARAAASESPILV